MPPTKPIRTYNELTEADRSQLGTQVAEQRDRIRDRLATVRHVVAVMSGKGGVGKSFVTAALASALARRGRKIGVLDADLHGPTTARMLAVEGGTLEVREDGVVPAVGTDEVRVMSTDLLLPEGAPLRWREPKDERFVWHGVLEAGMLREFLGDVVWGELDLLLVDLPPGTERLTALVQFVPALAGALAVTIPSDSSRRAVERAIDIAREAHVPLLGIVENMAGYVCPHCGELSPLFAGEAAQALAATSGASVLASIPFDPASQDAADRGRMPPGTGRVASAIRDLADGLLDRLGAP
jgi:ATP-binding protein involved in chromosome partitioning